MYNDGRMGGKHSPGGYCEGHQCGGSPQTNNVLRTCGDTTPRQLTSSRDLLRHMQDKYALQTGFTCRKAEVTEAHASVSSGSAGPNFELVRVVAPAEVCFIPAAHRDRQLGSLHSAV